MSSRRLIAVVDDDPAQLTLLTNALQRAGYATKRCTTGAEGIAAACACDAMLLDVRLPDISGLQVLAEIKNRHPGLTVILLTAHIDIRDAVNAVKQGAHDYLEKPIDLDELISVIDDAFSNGAGEPIDLAIPKWVVAESAAFRAVLAQAARVARSDASVLLLGESGTGKEVVAQLIHDASSRSSNHYERINCAAIPETLVESELFGHEKGAFTGAEARRVGCFEAANGGTLFLDEVGELPLSVQPKLLHVLENGTYRRVGAATESKCDVRIVAATNKRLEDEVGKQHFREDLYFRLNVVALELPPLRRRQDDILPIAEQFCLKTRKRLSPAAERMLMEYSWPGNIRELKNALERAAIMASGNLLLPTDFPPALQATDKNVEPSGILVGDMNEIQRRAIVEALEKTGGNRTQAAALLKISRRNLFYKLRDFNL